MPRRRFPTAGTVTAAAALVLAAAVVLLAGATETADAKKTTTTAAASLASIFLEAHNAARRTEGVPALRWDEGLAAYARRYAAARGGDCALAHSHGPYGENLFRGSGGAGWSPAAVVGAWVQERPLYDRGSNSCRRGAGAAACGHYTQVVWRRTTAVGCAMAPCNGGRATFAVCSYSPPGNYVGMRPYD